MKYKTIIFDLYQTIVKEETDELSDLVWKTFTSQLEAYSLHFDYRNMRSRYFQMDQDMRRMNQTYTYPEIDVLDIFDKLFREQGKHFSQNQLSKIAYEFRCCSRKFIQVYDGVPQLMETLHQNGCQVILLSNAQHCFTMPEIELMKLAPYFDSIYLSSDYGCMKPESDFFHLIFQNSAIKKSECIMIGDSLASDINGADAIEMDSLLLDNEGNQKVPEGSRCIGVIHSNRRDGILQFLE